MTSPSLVNPGMSYLAAEFSHETTLLLDRHNTPPPLMMQRLRFPTHPNIHYSNLPQGEEQPEEEKWTQ